MAGEKTFKRAFAAVILLALSLLPPCDAAASAHDGSSKRLSEGIRVGEAVGGAAGTGRPGGGERGTITGRLLLKNGEPLAGGKVHLFLKGKGPKPSRSRYWRTPDEIAATDKEGRFTVNLSPGVYYLSAIKKLSRDEIGPPVAGDYIYPESRDELKPELQSFTVRSGAVTDIGTIAQVVPFKRVPLDGTGPVTCIEGRITDEKGDPVAGAIVFAFGQENFVGKPRYVSERTGADGNYSLRLGEGGVFLP